MFQASRVSALECLETRVLSSSVLPKRQVAEALR